MLDTNSAGIRIQYQLISLLKKSESGLEFVGELAEASSLLFFGGAVRDIFLYPENPPVPRDYDIVIVVRDREKFKVIKSQYNHTQNRFGGYKFTIGETEFDIWELNNTWAFQNTKLESDEKNLVYSVFLSLDGIAYNWNSHALYNTPLRETLEKQEIDIVLEKNPYINLNLIKALVLQKKYRKDYSLNFSEKLGRVFKDLMNEDIDTFVKDLYKTQIHHFSQEHLTKTEIKDTLNKII